MSAAQTLETVPMLIEGRLEVSRSERFGAVFNPSTPYAVSRAAGDMSLRTYFANYRFPVVFTRAANVYGPGQRNQTTLITGTIQTA